MKKITFILLIIFFIILTTFKVDANDLTFPLLNKIIYIDPGHGGKDVGTSSRNIYEKDLNLQISLKLKERLEYLGATVFLTRNGDYDLSKPNALYRKKSDFDNRIILINNSNADLYLSIHQNYYQESKYYGPQVFYTTKNEENEILAKKIQDNLNKLASTNRKIKKVPKTYMYDKLNPKGVLIECGFLSNNNELNNLKNEKYQISLADSISSAIISFYN